MLLDTNAYTAIALGKKNMADLIAVRNEVISLPVVVIAELEFGFKLGTRYKDNKQKLVRFMSQDNVQVVDITTDTADIYSDLAKYCRLRGRSLANNDLWIAALAKQYDETLVTYDRDFEVLQDYLGDKLTIVGR